ncbi:MAG: HEAT repeat domain-containing protein [Phycisphaerae bacterium]
MKSVNACWIIALIVFSASNLLQAQQPLGYRGVDTSGKYPAEGLIRSWPEGGPVLAWKYEIGAGYAGVTVADGKVYIAGGEMSHLYVFNLTGELLGRHPIAGAGWKRFGGTRSTPLVKDDIVITTTPNAGIYAFDTSTESIRWNINAWKSFGAKKGTMGWGYPETPLLYKDKVILNTCSRLDATPPFIAVDVKTGDKVWETPAEKNDKDYYSAADVSGALFNHNGRDLVFYPSWRYVVMLDPTNGKKLWEIRKVGEKTLTPVYSDGYLLYGRGGAIQMLKLSRNGEDYKVLWQRNWPGGYSHAVILDGRVYVFGNPNEKPYMPEQINEPLDKKKEKKKGDRVKKGCGLLCLDAETGKLLHWEKAANNRGHVISADGKVIYTELVRKEGSKVRVPKVSLAVPTQDGFKITGSFIPELSEAELSVRDVDWQLSANPVVAEGKLFLRYGPLLVYELRADRMAQIRKTKAKLAELVNELDSKSADRRLAALEGIAKTGPQARSALKPLLKALRDPNEAVRKKAAGIVGDLGAMAAPALIGVLQDDAIWKQGHAAAAIVQATGADSLAEAIALTAETSKGIRKQATPLLVKTGSDAVEPLLTILGRGDKRTRWWVIEVFKELGPKAASAVNELIHVLHTHDQWFRAHAAETLGRIGPKASGAVPELIKLLDSQYPDARVHAAIALGKIGVDSQAVRKSLAEAQKDEDENVVKAAKKALQELDKG